MHPALIGPRNYDINTNVKFQTIQEIWIVDVPLNYKRRPVLIARQLLKISKEHYLISFGTRTGLGNESRRFASNFLIVLKLIHVFWENKRPRNKVIAIWIKMLSCFYYALKNVLASDDVDEGVPVYYLVVSGRNFEIPFIVRYYDITVSTRGQVPLMILLNQQLKQTVSIRSLRNIQKNTLALR